MPFKDKEVRTLYHREYYHLNEKEKAKKRYHKLKESDPVVYMLRGARSRAKKRNLLFNLEKEDIVIPQYCPALGLKLQFNTGGFKDNSPSLDRIDNNKGYIKENIQVLSYKANAMKSSATFEEIEKLYFYMKACNDEME